MNKKIDRRGGAREGAGRKGKAETERVKPMQIHLYEEELARLNAMAEEKGVKRNTLIHDILEDYFTRC